MPEVDAVSHALGVTAERLDRMLQRERAFSADASHQLRTPLTSLRVTLEAAELDPDADQDAAIGTALDEVDRLDRTIDDLVALAREVPGEATRHRPRAACSATSPPSGGVAVRSLGRPLDVGVARRPARGAGVGPCAPPDPRRPGRQRDPSRRGGRSRCGPGRRDPARWSRSPTRGRGSRVTPSASSTVASRNAGRSGIGLALARSLAEAEGGRLVLSAAGPPATTFSVFLPGRRPAADRTRDVCRRLTRPRGVVDRPLRTFERCSTSSPAPRQPPRADAPRDRRRSAADARRRTPGATGSRSRWWPRPRDARRWRSRGSC